MIISIILFEACNLTYKDFLFGRCRVQSSEVKWAAESEYKTTGIYHHATSKSTLKITTSDLTEITSKPGAGYIFDNKNISASCEGDGCDISFWFVNVSVSGGYIVADSTGVVFNISQRPLSDPYYSFVDFGPHSKIYVSQLEHPRKNSFHFWTSSHINGVNIINESILHSNDTLSFTEPALLQISEAPYDDVTFNIIVGSTLKNQPEFAQLRKPVKWSNIHYSNESDADTYALPSVEFDIKFYKHLMVACTSASFLFSIINALILPCLKKKSKIEDPQQVQQPLLQ